MVSHERDGSKLDQGGHDDLDAVVSLVQERVEAARCVVEREAMRQ